MDGGADRVDEALVTVVRREINRHLRLGHDRTRDFDVEHDLAIGRIGTARSVAGLIDRNRRDRRRRDPDLLEEELQVAAAEAAAEFDDRDRLAAAVERFAVVLARKVVAFGEFGGGDAVLGAGPAMRGALQAARRPPFWAGVEPEDAGDDASQFLRQHDLTAAAAVGAVGMVIELQIGMKGRQQIAELATQHDRPFGGAAMDNRQIVLLGEMLDPVEVFLRRTVLRLELVMGQIFAVGKRGIGEIVCHLGKCGRIPLAAHAHRDVDDFGEVDRTRRTRIRQQ